MIDDDTDALSLFEDIKVGAWKQQLLKRMRDERNEAAQFAAHYKSKLDYQLSRYDRLCAAIAELEAMP